MKLSKRQSVDCRNTKRSLGRPALSPEARDNQLISLTIDLVEQQLRDGTASPTIVAHYLKLGSSKERLERERLERENELLRAKVETLRSSQRSDEMYEKALKAMRSYSGFISDEEENDYQDYDEDNDYYDLY